MDNLECAPGRPDMDLDLNLGPGQHKEHFTSGAVLRLVANMPGVHILLRHRDE